MQILFKTLTIPMDDRIHYLRRMGIVWRFPIIFTPAISNNGVRLLYWHVPHRLVIMFVQCPGLLYIWTGS